MTAPALVRVHESPVTGASDAVMVAGLRRGDPATLRAFVARFEPVLRPVAHGRFRGDGEAEALVTDTLTDVALAFMRGEGCSDVTYLTAYVLRVFMTAVHNAQRARRRREDREGITDPLDAWEPRGVSEYALRASGFIEDDDDTDEAFAWVPPLSEAERQLLTWIGERVPQPLIAQWMGTSHAALRVRLCRLRARLRAAHSAHLS